MENKKYIQPHCKTCLLRTSHVLMVSVSNGGDKEDYTIVDMFDND